MDLVLLSAASLTALPRPSLVARVSAGSFLAVPVPWLLTYRTSSGWTPAARMAAWMARAAPLPSGCGAVG